MGPGRLQPQRASGNPDRRLLPDLARRRQSDQHQWQTGIARRESEYRTSVLEGVCEDFIQEANMAKRTIIGLLVAGSLSVATAALAQEPTAMAPPLGGLTGGPSLGPAPLPPSSPYIGC